MLSELNEVNDHLFIGSVRNVTNHALQKKGITCVVNCSMMAPSYCTHNLKYMTILVEDNDRCNIGDHFDQVCDAIHSEHLSGGKTLVYCVAGISRSATFCIAYLMKHELMSLRDAFRHLRSRRRIVRPNNGFFSQLIRFEERLFGHASVQMVRVPAADSPDCVVPDVFYELCRGITWLRSCKNYMKQQQQEE